MFIYPLPNEEAVPGIHEDGQRAALFRLRGDFAEPAVAARADIHPVSGAGAQRVSTPQSSSAGSKARVLELAPNFRFGPAENFLPGVMLPELWRQLIAGMRQAGLPE